MKTNLLKDKLIGINNNLNFIKFIAAIFVIIAHGFTLSSGGTIRDPLATFTNGRIGMGSFAVAIFFITSGLFITRSLERNNDFKHYFKSRFIRIFPPLVFTVVITVVLSGFFLTELPWQDYFTNPNTFKYLLNAILIPIHNLPGVFLNNKYGQVVNGALWTLPVEFLCYIIIYYMVKLGLTNKKKYSFTFLIVTLIFLVVNYIYNPLLIIARGYMYPMFMFYLGVSLYVFRNDIKLNYRVSIILIIISIFISWLGYVDIAMYFLFPYIFATTVFNHDFVTKRIASIGNISYSMYLCAFPIQQTLVSLNGGEMPVLNNCLYSIVCSIIVGYLIYVITEKRRLVK